MVPGPLLVIATIVAPTYDSSPARLTAGEVVSRMMVREAERQAIFRGYTASRRYLLENSRFHKRAEMLVRSTCREDGSKQFEVVSSTGWGGAREHVFPRLLEGEADAARPGMRERSRINPDNYTFKMVQSEFIRGRSAYVMEIEPKTQNKYLARGRIWVDAQEYAIVRIEGQPAKSPSFWIKSVHFVHEYQKTGPFWFPTSDRSVTDVRFFGATEMTIEYFDYLPQSSPRPLSPGN